MCGCNTSPYLKDRTGCSFLWLCFSSFFFFPFLPGSRFAKHKKWRRPGTSHQPDRQQPWWFDRKDHLCSDLRSRIISPSISCKKVRRLRFSFFCPSLLFVTLWSWTKVHFPLQLQSTAAKQTSARRVAAAVRRINSGEDKSTVREQNPTWLQVFTPPDSLALSSTPDPPRTSLRSYILCFWTINQSCFSRAPATTNVRAPRSRYPRCSFGLGKSGLIGKVKERKKLELKATSAAKIRNTAGLKRALCSLCNDLTLQTREWLYIIVSLYFLGG